MARFILTTTSETQAPGPGQSVQIDSQGATKIIVRVASNPVTGTTASVFGGITLIPGGNDLIIDGGSPDCKIDQRWSLRSGAAPVSTIEILRVFAR